MRIAESKSDKKIGSYDSEFRIPKSAMDLQKEL